MMNILYKIFSFVRNFFKKDENYQSYPILPYNFNDESFLHSIVFENKIYKYMYLFDNDNFNNIFESINKYKNYIMIYYDKNCTNRFPMPKNINEKLIYYSANGDIENLKKLIKKNILRK